MTITAAVDGSALHNPGPAGWCWYIDDDCWAAGGWKEGTNNRGELTALAELLRATAHLADEHLHVLCDSQYVINSVTKWMPGWKRKGWKKRDGKPVLNVDILQDIDALLVGRKIDMEWVKGHSGHDMNEAADQRARAAATAYQKGTKVPHGPGFGSGASQVAPTAAASAAASRSAESSQQSLFDFDSPAVDSRTETLRTAAEQALTTLRRAARRAEQGSDRALRTLLADAVTNVSVEQVAGELSSASEELTVIGATAVALLRGEGWTALATWSLEPELKLVGWHLSR
ncbi:ribonuclease H family protein [Corynebacterium lactis]|uniref:ribonuclease H n=1 Tax=Corynebacterium lactis RW2-5 TaxID=1408189 RepID=A0A0K2H0E0_9CORY|nr:ribonuclease H [Corynebacterium lactis]ALA67512.1 ribonuclease H [Corynebacterium lactis RW2-5]